MLDHIFRQYDIRGKVDSEMTICDVYALTQSIAYYFKQQDPDIKTIALGADGRIHSLAIKQEVCRALQDAGLDVVFIGICPTPVLYFSLFTLSVDAGLMITASHNGKEYNGIKICFHKESVWGEQIQQIKNIYKKAEYIGIAQQRGIYQEHLLIPGYVSWLADQFTHLQGIPINAVIDCGNGAAGTVLPLLCEIMQWHHIKLLYSEVDGTYPHHDADPTQEKNMLDVRTILLSTDAEIGIGLDGDADRMVAMTKGGQLVLGDKMLSLFAKKIAETTPDFLVVYDIKCSSGLAELLKQWGIRSFLSPTGHSIIKKNLKKHNAVLAGELSCHFFFADRYFGYDDGIYAMLRLFEIVHTSALSLDELLQVFPKKIVTPEIRFTCQEEIQPQIMQHVHEYFTRIEDVHISLLDGIRVTFNSGWGMLRPSHTQPVLCARFEANTDDDMKHIRDEFINALEGFYTNSYLRGIFK